MWITWRHEHADFASPLTFDEKVEVFYEQTLGWQLHIADLIASGGTTFGEFKNGSAGYQVPSIRHSGFAVLHICFSYIELIGSLVQKSGRSAIKTFEAGLRVIPGLIDASHINEVVVEKLYDGVRCGLYHEGRTRPGVGLGQPPDGTAMAYDSHHAVIGISPERLPRVLKSHLDQFKQDLLDVRNAELRARFEDRFDSGFARPTEKARRRTSRTHAGR
jgi:hypothetical protein